MGVCVCLTLQGQTPDSLALRQRPDSTAPRTARADTSFYLQGRNSRIGFNSFVLANVVRGRIRTQRWTTLAEGGQNFLYNKNLTGGGGRFIQQDYYLRGEQTYRLVDELRLGYRFGTYAFRAIGNAFGRYEGLLRWQPTFRRLSLYTEGSAGVAVDKRGSIENAGPSYGLRAWGSALSRDSATEYTWQGYVAQAFISPRQMALWSGKAGLTQRVGDFGLTRVTAGYLRRRVEDYNGSQIQQILSDSLELGLFLGSQLGKKVALQSDNRVLVPTRQFNYRPYDTARTTVQNTRFTQTEVYSQQLLSVEGSRLRQTFSLDLTVRARSYYLDNNLGLDARSLERAAASERIKNISEQTVGYGYTGAWQISRRSSLKGSWAGSLLRVNTPSDQNDQDRDEAFYTSDLAWTHRWLKTLRSSLKLSGSLREVVFVRGTQSAQNYTERVLRLEPMISYALGPVRMTSSFGVWATYNVREFAQEQAKNRANRIWIQNYQLRYNAPRRWYALADLLRRENRIAQLNWAQFSETPIDTVVVTDLHLRGGKSFASARLGGEISIEAGYKLFRQDRHYLAGVAVPGLPTRQAALHTITLQHGPSTALVWELPGRGRIILDGWLQWARTRNRYKLSNEVFVGQTYSAEQLAVVDRRLYVFFNLTGQVVLK